MSQKGSAPVLVDAIGTTRMNKDRIISIGHASACKGRVSAVHVGSIFRIPVLPQTRAAVELDRVWAETSHGVSYSLLNNGGKNKNMAFSTHAQLQVLQSADTIYMDGTCTSCTDLWNQVYIIHAWNGSKSYPLVHFTVLPDRQIATYSRHARLHRDSTETQPSCRPCSCPD